MISVIIPTLHRPLLVMRAVNSVLTQSMTDLEVVVVIDGPSVGRRGRRHDALPHGIR